MGDMASGWVPIAGVKLFPFGFPPLLVGLLIAALGITVLIRERNTRISLAFFALTMSTAPWFVATALAYSTSDQALALAWQKIGQASVAFVPSMVLIFTASMVRRFAPLRVFIGVSVFLSFFFFLAILFTRWFVRGLYHYPWGYHLQFGFLCYGFVLFFFVVLLGSLFLFWQALKKTTVQIQRARIKSFLYAFSIGYLGSLDFLPGFGIPFYPFGYVPIFISLLMVARAIWIYRLVDITPSFAANQILATMVNPLIVCDQDLMIRFVNDMACEIFGYEEKELLGQPIEVLAKHSQEEKQRLVDAFQNLLVKNQELVFNTKKGQPVDVSVSISHFHGHSQTRLGSILVASDIRERKQAEKAILEKTFELARSNAEREHLELFAYVASHDLREPLQKIMGFGELLEKNYQMALPAEGRDYLNRMIKATLRMNQLIEDLIQFSKVAVKAEPAQSTSVNLNETLQEVLSDLEMKIAATQGQVQFKDLPPVYANRLEMHQLFQNLISNALKFHKKDESSRILITGQILQNGLVEFSIEDNGIGFDVQYADRIFKPFERLHGRTDYEGSGLGLAICHRIVKNYGGQITAHSSPGKGAIFTFTLPQQAV